MALVCDAVAIYFAHSFHVSEVERTPVLGKGSSFIGLRPVVHLHLLVNKARDAVLKPNSWVGIDGIRSRWKAIMAVIVVSKTRTLRKM